MCAERLHRIVIAIILGLVMGMAGAGMIKLAFLSQLFVMIMLFLWAFSDFCPSLYLLRKIIPSCYESKNQ
ncbi:hypothetical protein MNB_SV-6-277 [hydrothermal vent metagenome]|uniref:Rhodanese-related sulfurtransferase n=1 Tax=hydrothermal vent metagenome TaxID=652676 RepID=A0A1W1BTB6_9ZZZZ